MPTPYGSRLLLAAALWQGRAAAWNSFATVHQLYTFQELYTDAQYGPDFGYYSTGRILHADGPSDNGRPEEEGSQAWFNSYTTLPMALSPHFGHMLCDRLVSMWQAMGRPSPFMLTEFGGGTGMLARDILKRARDAHGDFFAAIGRYFIGERSAALRSAQRWTAAEFISSGKLQILAADGRHASQVRPALQEVAGAGQPIYGAVLSNELLDEFDPVRLRLVWHKGRVPSKSECMECKAFREAYVLHSVDIAALVALLRRDQATGVPGEAPPATVQAAVEEISWEGSSMLCGLLKTPALTQAMLLVLEELSPAERHQCAPSLVCCFPFVLAVDQALQYHHDALQKPRENDIQHGAGLAHLYRFHLNKTNGTIPLTKHRYRELRRLASAHGIEVEKALLSGANALLPGRLYSQEIFLALAPSRCRELSGWMRRNAARLASAVILRDGTAAVFDGEYGDLSPPRTAIHLKLVLRPGEAAFAETAAHLVDEGFLVTMDYGADADALIWQALIRPHYEGINIVDARVENHDECTSVSYLECPGLQDLTTSVDFTEVAVAGAELGGWTVRAYGPIFLLELGFDQSEVRLGLAGDPYNLGHLGHLVERADGFDSMSIQAWYRKPEADPWASFKLLVQHRGSRGAAWRLGPLAPWPLQATPRLLRAPSPCWRRDLSKPPMASLITVAAHHALGDRAWAVYAEAAAGAASPAEAAALTGGSLADASPEEGAVAHEALLMQFLAILSRGGEPLAELLDLQHVAQQQAYADTHLALLLVDYWRFWGDGAQQDWHDRLEEVRHLASVRQFPRVYGESAFERVFADLSRFVFADSTLGGADEIAPYVCLAAEALHGSCCSGAPAPPVAV